MSKEQCERTARCWFEDLWSKADLDVADAIIDPGYAPDWVQIDTSGPEQIKHEIRYFRSIFPDLEYDIVDMLAAEDRVWVRYRAAGTQSGSAWGFEPSGKRVEFEGATVLTVSPEGKVVDRWGAFCFYDLLVDLGHVPPLWELSAHLSDSAGGEAE